MRPLAAIAQGGARQPLGLSEQPGEGRGLPEGVAGRGGIARPILRLAQQEQQLAALPLVDRLAQLQRLPGELVVADSLFVGQQMRGSRRRLPGIGDGLVDLAPLSGSRRGLEEVVARIAR